MHWERRLCSLFSLLSVFFSCALFIVSHPLFFVFFRVAQLQQINNVFGELHKDSQWADIEKQFKHDPSSRTIDWDYLQENLKYPEIIAAYKESLDKIKFQDIEVDSQFGEMDALVAQYSADIRAQNKKYQEKLPQLERDIAHTEQFKANIRTMTVEEQRPHDPKIFQEIDQELDAWNWDDEPIVAETHGKH